MVRKGDYIYLEFGPLYYAPFGEHAYRSITVPYCQFSFQKNLISDFAIQKGLDPIDFDHVNGWSFESYRELWSEFANYIVSGNNVLFKKTDQELPNRVSGGALRPGSQRA